jgi:hypothetical protein
MADFQNISGACFCGDNQFEISEPAVDTHHCHCSICRRMQGAPLVTLSVFPKTGFKWTKGGDLDTFNSSDTVHRHRCKNCGTPLTIELDAMPDVVAVSRANLAPGAEPGYPEDTMRHAFWPDRVEWLDINDNVRHTEGFS